MALSLAACAKKDNTNNNGTTPGETTPAETTPEETDPVSTTASAVELLQKVFDSYVEDERPAMSGGAGDTMNMDGPGAIAAGDESLGYTLLVPEDQMSLITDAASMLFMMNANSLTIGAFKINGDTGAFVEAMKTAVSGNQWMCGFPDKVMFYSVDGYVVMAFGLNDFLTPFNAALTTAYPDAALVAEQDLM